MPGWKLRKAPKNKWGDDAYWVVDETGKHYSKDPMPKKAARQQQKAIYASESSGELHGAGTRTDFVEWIKRSPFKDAWAAFDRYVIKGGMDPEEFGRASNLNRALVDICSVLDDKDRTTVDERRAVLESAPDRLEAGDRLDYKQERIAREVAAAAPAVAAPAPAIPAAAPPPPPRSALPMDAEIREMFSPTGDKVQLNPTQIRKRKGGRKGKKRGGADYTTLREGDAPTFDEYLASKGLPTGSFAVEQLSPTAFKEVTREGDEVAFDEKAFKENMARMKSKADYERATRGRTTAQPYADYARTFEANARARATKNLGVERRKGLDKTLQQLTSEAYADYAREYPDAIGVTCNIGADGERLTSPDYTTAGDCKRRHKLNYRKEMDKDPFGKVVNVLTDVADSAVDLLPGVVGQVASAAYKQFAPPTSKFGRGKKAAEKFIKMSRSDFEKEHKHLIKLLRTSKDPKILKEAADQAAEMHAVLSGSGLFDTLVKGAKTIVGRISDVTKGIRRDYPPDVRRTLAAIGDKPVVAMNIRRDPIRSVLNTAINFLTLGKWNEARKRYAYDKVFHLGVEFELPDGKIYVAEKNQTLNIAPTTPSDADTERLAVALPTHHFTVNEMLFKTRERQGDKFFLYDAFTNNCQDWIVDLLTANGLANAQNLAFVKQPLEGVLQTLPGYTSKIARMATDLAAIGSVAIKGRGRVRPHPAFSKQLKEVGIKPTEYLAAVRSLAVKAGYDPKDVMFADTDEHKIAIKRPDGGVTRAGRVGYGDFILWSYLEAHKKAEPGTAAKKRATFHASHSKIKGDWKADKYSPNNIALKLLW